MNQKFCAFCGKELNISTGLCEKCESNSNSGVSSTLGIPKNFDTKKIALIGKIIFYIISIYLALSALLIFSTGTMFSFMLPMVPLDLLFESGAIGVFGILMLAMLGIIVYSYFFSSNIISKIVVKFSFVTSLLSIIGLLLSLILLVLTYIFPIISEETRSMAAQYANIYNNEDLYNMVRTQIRIEFILAIFTLVLFAGYLYVLLNRWYKKNQNINGIAGIKQLFTPKPNFKELFIIIKTIK
ncbi:hypothetical protein AB1K83_13540 [Sporosarcina sp. 179-K 3D1 HS]|uniref:hypothetical protein n=1 Tax=Sporosarcina sp. 179-K 3D1 HS TaxID=3232169 RepID=UPI0039A05C92